MTYAMKGVTFDLSGAQGSIPEQVREMPAAQVRKAFRAVTRLQGQPLDFVREVVSYRVLVAWHEVRKRKLPHAVATMLADLMAEVARREVDAGGQMQLALSDR